MQAAKNLVAANWVYVWGSLFSIGWVLPVPFTLWFGFQAEVWIAASSLIAAMTLLWKYADAAWEMPSLVAALAAFCLIPLLQWGMGTIVMDGHALLCVLYLVAFALVVWCGFTWEKVAPGQCLDALFYAITIAALITVCLQISQWRGIGGAHPWWLVAADPTRPHGNFGQANLAATFLCWGLCALAWFSLRQCIPWYLATSLAAVLLLGIALSNSRTAFLGLIISIALVFFYHKLWTNKWVLWVVAGLALYFFICVIVIQWINDKEFGATVLSAGSLSARFQIWMIALEAIQENPWLGYGWGQTYAAQLAVADRMPAFYQPFISAHNLVIDLILWNGIPLALLMLAGMGLWLYRRVKNINTAETFIPSLCILLIANHSMLELPMHYAFLLLPLGWLLGAMEARLANHTSRVIKLPRAVPLVSFSLMAAFLMVVGIEYWMIDDAYRIQSLKKLNLTSETWREPKVRLLNHLVSQLKLEQLDINQRGLSPAQLKNLEGVAKVAPGPSPMIMVAGALAMNGQPERAQWWLRRICKVTTPEVCNKFQENWIAVGEKHPEIAAIAWPQDAGDTAGR